MLTRDVIGVKQNDPIGIKSFMNEKGYTLLDSVVYMV